MYSIQKEVTIGIPTKDRYASLCNLLLSIALLRTKPMEVIIVDDTEKPVDIRDIPVFTYILKLFDDYNIEWKVLFGAKKGQHYSHQLIQEEAKYEYILRVDDDCILEPDVVEHLHNSMYFDDKIGAVAPAVLMSDPKPLPEGLENKISRIYEPNIQWFTGHGIHEAEHLYSCFMYRKGINRYDLTLSPVAHREETIFSYGIFKEGYKLLVNFDAVVWHFRGETGGIRSQHDTALWDNDEKIFQGYLNLWNVDPEIKYIVLNNGLGDHYAFKNILPDLRKKYSKIKIACCYPEVFHDEPGLELTSIQEAIDLFGNIDHFNVYHFMDKHNWTYPLWVAYGELYL